MSPTPKKSDTLVYTGGATTRRITRVEWEAAGIKGQDTVVFDKSNNKTVKIGDAFQNMEALTLLLERDGKEFRVHEDKTPAPNGQ